MEHTDTYRHKGLRKKLAEIVAAKGITEDSILAAIEHVPRHFFIDDTAFAHRAYEDTAFPIGEGQTISQPFTVAYQTQLLQFKPGMKVLEIGTGSGYQACILAALGAKVFTIERQRKLFDKTSVLLKEMGYERIKTTFGDGYAGWPAFAPFDRILVTAAAPEIPEALLQQLKPGGILVIPVGSGKIQVMKRITRQPDGKLVTEEFENFTFVPMLKGMNKS